jgi:integrase
MRKKRFSVEQVISVLKQAEAGIAVAEVIRKAGISEQYTSKQASSIAIAGQSTWITKNGDARTVHLNPDALAAVESILHRGRKRSNVCSLAKAAPVSIVEWNQERFDNRSSWFEPAITEAGIFWATWHGLRHTFCSWLAMAGATTREVMEAAGHKTMSQAARYSRLSPQHTQSVMDRIAGTRTVESNMHQNMHQLFRGMESTDPNLRRLLRNYLN